MRRILLLAYGGAQGLDIFGPAETFAAARRYRVVLASSRGQTIETTSGLAVKTTAVAKLRVTARDTVLVAGGEEAGVRGAVGDAALVAFVRKAAPVAERVGSVCSGAFVLAAAGLLDGRRAATHWQACARLARYRPAVTVDADAIYVRDGKLWTSAGVTTGIDMALAMIEADHGRELADAVAGRLVLYARRPGFQSQWSSALVAQQDAGELSGAIAWLRANLRAPVHTAQLARRAGLSERTLHRRCLAQLGLTPRRLVEKVRVEEARLLLHTTRLAPKLIASRCGFGTPAQLARACQRVLGVAPRTIRLSAAPA